MKQRCWICNRTEEECLKDFKKIALEGYEEIEDEEIEDKKFGDEKINNVGTSNDIINNDNIYMYPEGSEWFHELKMPFIGWNGETKEYMEYAGKAEIHLCIVCHAILDYQWESLKRFVFERIKDYHFDVRKAMDTLEEEITL